MIIGIDMGGTHIDGVLLEAGRIQRSLKQPVRADDLPGTIWGMLETLLEDVPAEAIRRIHLSTTISTNAIVEDKTAEVAVLLQAGPGLKWDYSTLGSHVYHLEGYVDHRGEMVQPPSQRELRSLRQTLGASEVEALAIVSKFSTRNPASEQQIAELFASDYAHITLGHSLSGKLNYPRRVHTAYLNAAVHAVFARFADEMQAALQALGVTAPIYILKADGGTMDLETAKQKPVESILSGPAASFMGLSALFPDLTQDAVLLDIGGTTTDIFFLADGIPLFEPHGIEIAGHKTLVRAVYSASMGLGGDSWVRVEDGDLRIGPQRLGPAVAYGGEHLTPTDALVVLGRMEGAEPHRSRAQMESLAQALELSVEAAAEQILEQMCQGLASAVAEILERINSRPVYTIQDLLHGDPVAPQRVRAIGGPVQALAPSLEAAFGLQVEVPEAFTIANAIGAALAKPTAAITLHADTERRRLIIPEREVDEPIDRSYNLRQAETRALQELHTIGEALGLPDAALEAEITEAESFNMVQGYAAAEKNIRVRAQIKPGLLERLEQSHAST